ncbi:MAG: GNAT family N-acetyltransferase [Armatimonadetes bacterium]|nr:GNAT family N-acetyltransferase [Armatimonadota bacterium]
MPPFQVTNITAELAGVTIEPLKPEHAPLLAQISTPETFQHYLTRIDPHDEDNFLKWVNDRNAPGSFGHLIRLNGEPVGSSSIYDISDFHRSLEIGHTWYTPDQRGTALNPIVKLIMIGKAIEDWRAMRVQLKTDARNEPSIKAMRKLAFREEGILKNHLYLPHQERWRDTMFFSVTPDIWPQVRWRLIERIEEFGISI